MREFPADHRAGLGDLLHWGESVEPGHQRVVQGRRNRERHERAGERVVIPGIGKQTGFEHGLGQFLDE